MTLPEIDRHRERYLAELRAVGALASPEVERAFSQVRRDVFLSSFYAPDGLGRPVEFSLETNPEEALKLVYSDTALGTQVEQGRVVSSSSQPSLMASMLADLNLHPGMRVLEIGAGSGYNAALIASIVGDPSLVTTVDNREVVCQNAARALARMGLGSVHVELGDGYFGAPDSGPYDRVIVTVGCGDVSPNWSDQLRADGIAVVPLEHARLFPIVRVRQESTQLYGGVTRWSAFVAAGGRLQPKRRLEDLALVDDGVSGEPAWGAVGGALAGGSLSQWSDVEAGFYFFVSVRDESASFLGIGFGIVQSPTSWAGVRRGRIVSSGDASVFTRLNELYAEWLELGCPSLGLFALAFRDRLRTDAGVDRAGKRGPWQLSRHRHLELVSV